MNKREFLKSIGIGAAAYWGSQVIPGCAPALMKRQKSRLKNWVWITTDVKKPDDEWISLFRSMRRAGIDAIVPEVYDGHRAYYASRHLTVGELWLERLLPLAKAEGLEVHAWMWCMPCNNEEVRTKHPEWFAVNRKGESAGEKPAYVDYYRFLCPSRSEVHEFIRATVSELSDVELLDGVHLDYIRFPDVILAEGLQPKYGIVQDREFPEYDYCYCEVCRAEFRSRGGSDPLAMQDPSTSGEWRQFRYDQITRLVNGTLIPVARAKKKQITAAVFPNWEMVRQEWSQWDLDAVLPMLYHGFYNQGIDWIGEQTKRGIASLRRPIPLYSGLFIPQLTPESLEESVAISLEAGAAGVSLFSAQAMTAAHWQSLGLALKK